MIGDYKQTNSDIDATLYPQDKPFDMYIQGTKASSTPLYTPPEEDLEDIIAEKRVEDCVCTYANEDEPSSSTNESKISDVRDVNPNVDVFKRMSDIIIELDLVKQKLANEETIQMINFCQDKIIEGLSRSGAQLIDNEEIYSNSRHSPIPYGIYPEGIPIKQTIRPGMIVKNDVVLKALVELYLRP